MRRSKYATRMGIRARRVGAETQKHLGQVGKELNAGYKAAMQEEIYDRTPRPVTGKLMRSIKIEFHGRSVHVFNDLGIAPYARYRRRATGMGNYKGQTWRKDTEWDVSGWKRAWPKIKQVSKGMHRRILSGR